MFLSLSCPGSDPTSFLSAENIVAGALGARVSQGFVRQRLHLAVSSHNERRGVVQQRVVADEEVKGPCPEARTKPKRLNGVPELCGGSLRYGWMFPGTGQRWR